jgi:hypothetical protein
VSVPAVLRVSGSSPLRGVLEAVGDALRSAPSLKGGACTLLPPGELDTVFWPHPGAPAHAWDVARAMCARCPVLNECRQAGDQLEAGASPSSIQGFRGGETPRERMGRRLRPSGSKKITPYQPCGDCGRPLRARKATVEQFPGTVRHASHGLCDACNARRKRQERKTA